MKTTALLVFAVVVLWPATLCSAQRDSAQEELQRAEAAFFRHILDHGFGAGLAAFMADDAMIANSLTLGRDAQLARTKSEAVRSRGNVVRWKPLRAEVAASGDLGYSWGVAESGPAKDGPFKPYGIYVIIWKRQADGQWKFVYDAATILGADAVEKFLREKFPAAATN
ncbi:MAG: nuclear transport factor 2 family protein [Opitutaceae bacterium]|nr:nuclear transport factor 2 family protein [Opitutaceae bacterium]